MCWVLIAGNGPRASDFIRRLRREDFRVSLAGDPAQLLANLAARAHDCVVFIDLSTADSGDYCDQLRHEFSASYRPLLPLLALGNGPSPWPEGAIELPLFWYDDDPGAVLLLARLRALLRRASGYVFYHRFGVLGVDPLQGRASLNGQPLDLRPMEFNLLLLLVEAVIKR